MIGRDAIDLAYDELNRTTEFIYIPFHENEGAVHSRIGNNEAMNWTSRRFFLRSTLVVGVLFLLTLVTLTLVSYNIELLRPQDIPQAGNRISQLNICIVPVAHLLLIVSFYFLNLWCCLLFCRSIRRFNMFAR